MSTFRRTMVTRTQPAARSLRCILAGTTVLTAAAVCGWLATASPTWALPTDGAVVEGQAEIEYGAESVTIRQGSDRVIIEWQTFEVAANERVTFVQPHALAAALNRVLSGEASEILGSLSSNGQIFISNPAGVVFGPDAEIDVASIVATSLDIMDDRFMVGGRLEFDIAGDPTAVVENRGTINASGLAALVGPGVRNSGTIVADVAILGGGQGFALDYYGDGLVNFAITDPTTQLPLDSNGNPVGALAENTGAILADGGQVILTADAAAGVIDDVINLDGVVQARTVGTQEGQVVLLGGDEGTVQVAGTINATGDDAGETGGTVHVLGDRLELDLAANIDASGPAGGGTVLIGGAERGGAHAPTGGLAYLAPAAGGRSGTTIVMDAGYETEDFIPEADIVYIAAGAEVAADAVDRGDGGTVIAWANQEMDFQGRIRARGGAVGGNGGFAEVSGGHVTVTGAFDLSAAAGQSGGVLIDPTDLCAAAAAGNCTAGFSFVDIQTIEAALESGTDFTLDTSNAPGGDAGQAGNIEIVDAITVNFADDPSADNAATFSAIADADLVQNAPVRGTNGVLNIDYRARGGEIDVNATLSVGGVAAIVMLARSHIRADASIRSGTGATSLVAGWDGVTTDIDAILATPAAYGIDGGTIFIGNGNQGIGIAVGSRFGASNFAAAAMRLRGSSTADRGFAQAGFRDPGSAGFDIGGAITIALSDGDGTPGNLTATAGSRPNSYVQIGHGGRDLNPGVEPDGNYTGSITIAVANDIIFTATGGNYAQLGHGGNNADGSHGGAITIERAGDLTFTGGTGPRGYAQLGHGGNSADASHGGEIRIDQAIDLTFTGGTGEGAYAQLGHGGNTADGSHSGNIVITRAGNLAFTGGGEGAYAQLGHGGRLANGDHSGTITVTQARDVAFAGGTNPQAYAQLGHGGWDADGNHSGAIDVTVLANLTLTGQDAADQYALIGHGDEPGDGDAGNTVSGSVLVPVGSEATLANAFIGHLIDDDGTYGGGDTIIGAGVLLAADAASAFNSAPTGELRIYVASAAGDAVEPAARLNGIAHGVPRVPNDQGAFAFELGPYDPLNPVAGSALVAGNFAYYTLPFAPTAPPPPPGAPALPTDVETLLDEIPPARSRSRDPGGAAFFTNERGAPFQINVFGDGFSIGGVSGPGGLSPAAGGPPGGPDGPPPRRTGGPPSGSGGPPPAAGGRPGPPVNFDGRRPLAGPGSAEAESEDDCVETYVSDVWEADTACE